MILRRLPRTNLRPFIVLLWAQDATLRGGAGLERERVLPMGAMHIAIRLGGKPLRVFADAADDEGEVIGGCVIGGVRNTAYIKEVADPAPMVGAMLRPGAADLLSGTPAGLLAGSHTRLDDLWRGADLAELRERLEAASTLESRLTIFEEALASRLPSLRGIDPLIAHALFRLDRGVAVGDVVEESGFSHRHIVRVFAEAVGVPPKVYLRLKRFNRAVKHLHAAPEAALAAVAVSMGYADQAHMTREFQAFAGLTPGRYRRAAPDEARHVPLSV